MPDSHMIPQLIVAAAIAASVWQIQEWRYGAKETARVQQNLLETQQAAARDIRRLDNAIGAQNAAVLRERVVRDEAAHGRLALISLSDAAAEAIRRAQASHAACLDTAAAQSVVLNQCGERYRGMAEIADRHVNDIKTLTDIHAE